MEPAERARGHDTHHQDAPPRGDDITGGAEIEISHTQEEQPRDDEIRKSPEHVHGGGGKTFAGRSGEGALKGPPHHAADEMGNGVGEKGAAEKVEYVVKPVH